MASHHLVKFGGQRHCGSEYMMFSLVKGQDSTCSRFNQISHYCLSLKPMACYTEFLDFSRCVQWGRDTCLKEHLTEWHCNTFWVTLKRNKVWINKSMLINHSNVTMLLSAVMENNLIWQNVLTLHPRNTHLNLSTGKVAILTYQPVR